MAWNVLHGGGSSRMPGIALELLESDAHTLILIEFRRSIGGQIAGVLADHGWEHQLHTDPPHASNGLFVASKSPIVREATPRFGRALPEHRWIGFASNALGCSIAALHAPDNSNPIDRKHFWRSLTRFARAAKDHPLLLIGDFNATRQRSDAHAAASNKPRGPGRLAALGYVDAWRKNRRTVRDYTWFSRRGGGYRLDHAWASPALSPRVIGAHHNHRGREQSLSDHAAIMVDLRPPDQQFTLFPLSV